MTTIRPAEINDLPAVEAIVHEAIHHMRGQGIDQWDEIYPDREILESDIRQNEMYVIQLNGNICGFIVVNDEASPEYSEVDWNVGGRVFVIHRLTVAPGCQSQGLARKLMQHVESMAAGNGYDTIRLDAFAYNPRAVKFYEQLGYRKAGAVYFRKGMFFCYEKEVPSR